MIIWFDLLARLIDWNCGNVILIRTQDILQFGWGVDRRLLKQNYNESLAMSLLEILCSLRSSCFSCVLRLQRFVVEVLRCFKGLNPKSFIDLWFVRFLEAFELDSSKLQNLDWEFGWFCFECSSILRLKFLKTLRLDSYRAFVLLSASESSLMLLVL